MLTHHPSLRELNDPTTTTTTTATTATTTTTTTTTATTTPTTSHGPPYSASCQSDLKLSPPPLTQCKYVRKAGLLGASEWTFYGPQSGPFLGASEWAFEGPLSGPFRGLCSLYPNGPIYIRGI